MAHGQETGSGKPALRQALQARGLELDLIFGLPSGPAAWNAPQQRPHTCQHPTTGHTAPKSPAEKKSNDSKGLHPSLSAASMDSKADQRRLTVKALGSEACQR